MVGVRRAGVPPLPPPPQAKGLSTVPSVSAQKNHLASIRRTSARPSMIELEEFSDGEASSASTASSHSVPYRRARRISNEGYGRTVSTISPRLIDLTGIRRRENAEPDDPPADPAIIWKTKVYWPRNGRFDSEREIESRKPDLTYVDDRPIQLSLGVNPTQPQIKPEPAEWTGPVISIEVFAETDGPRISSLETVDRRSLDMLNPTRMSRRYLVVESELLKEALFDIVEYYPAFYHDRPSQPTRGILRIQEPFAVLFHHFDAIEARADGTSGVTMCRSEHDGNTERADTMKRHMQHLIEFLRPFYQERILNCQKHLSGSVPRVAFDMIWYLLKPGIDVYVYIDGSIHVAVVLDVKLDAVGQSDLWKVPENEEVLRVGLWQLETDGIILQRNTKSVRMHPYSGLQDVTSLPICPVSIWDKWDNGERRQQILRRSGIFFKALSRGNLLVDYNGPIKGTNQYYAGKLVIDHRRGLAIRDRGSLPSLSIMDHAPRFQEYDEILINNDLPPLTVKISRPWSSGSLSTEASRRRAQRGTQTRPNVPVRETNNPSNAEPSESVVRELTEHQLLLLPSGAQAYALGQKEWISISLDYVREPVPSDESISNLIIGQDELKTIQALSNRQNSKTRQWSADFIDGKGSGQIILLHGPPGVGKTYTVEAISEWLHRPLLALTVADIGTVETLVEGELVKWFNLAEAWNGVLLVDEADIFLERRQNRDLSRNGLVSAFLRRMEYFKGLLFLTTNRVGQIDDAFISRIHIAISYQALDAETRRKVWNGFFRKLVRDRAGKIQIAPDAKTWVLETTGETQLNGRDIRNALQTAITLAEFESQEDPDYDPSLVTIVTKSHFQRVLEMSNRFRNYVSSIRREDEKKRAQGRGDRNDYGGGVANEMEML